MSDQLVTIAAAATTFSVVCEACARDAEEHGWAGTTIAGRLDLDLQGGIFLCRRGHEVEVERQFAAESPARSLGATEAA